LHADVEPRARLRMTFADWSNAGFRFLLFILRSNAGWKKLFKKLDCSIIEMRVILGFISLDDFI
jgi:hypothetical protein